MKSLVVLWQTILQQFVKCTVLYRTITQTFYGVGSVGALRDIGIEITRSGDLSFNENKFVRPCRAAHQTFNNVMPGRMINYMIALLKGWPAMDIDLKSHSPTPHIYIKNGISVGALANYEEELVELEARMNNYRTLPPAPCYGTGVVKQHSRSLSIRGPIWGIL